MFEKFVEWMRAIAAASGDSLVEAMYAVNVRTLLLSVIVAALVSVVIAEEPKTPTLAKATEVTPAAF
jgi:hypothetical protein